MTLTEAYENVKAAALWEIGSDVMYCTTCANPMSSGFNSEPFCRVCCANVRASLEMEEV